MGTKQGLNKRANMCRILMLLKNVKFDVNRKTSNKENRAYTCYIYTALLASSLSTRGVKCRNSKES